MLLLQSCVSNTVVKVPEISFPDFPPIPENVTVEDDMVVVPQEWIIELSVYRIKMEEAQKTYEGLRRIYED